MKPHGDDDERPSSPLEKGYLVEHYREVERLVGRSQRSDLVAKHALWHKVQPLIRTCLRTYRNDLELCQDLSVAAYEVFDRLLREFDPMRGIFFLTYLEIKLMNALAYLAQREYLYRSRFVQSTEDSWDSCRDLAESSYGNHQSVAWGEAEEQSLDWLAIEAHLDQLPVEQRQVLRLRREGWTSREIAQVLGVAEATCRQWAKRGIAQVRKWLKE